MCFFDKKQLAIPIQRVVSSVRAPDTRVYLSTCVLLHRSVGLVLRSSSHENVFVFTQVLRPCSLAFAQPASMSQKTQLSNIKNGSDFEPNQCQHKD